MALRDFSLGRLWIIRDGMIYLGNEGERWHGWIFEQVPGHPAYLLAMRKADADFLFRALRAKANNALTEATLVPGRRDTIGCKKN